MLRLLGSGATPLHRLRVGFEFALVCSGSGPQADSGGVQHDEDLAQLRPETSRTKARAVPASAVGIVSILTCSRSCLSPVSDARRRGHAASGWHRACVNEAVRCGGLLLPGQAMWTSMPAWRRAASSCSLRPTPTSDPPWTRSPS